MDPLDTLEVTRRRSGHRWLDLVVGGSAIVIAVISLIVALRQSQIMERQLAASTWPYLQYDTSNQADDRSTDIISLELKNAGVGPARVHRLTMLYEGKPVRDAAELVAACCSDLLASNPKPNWTLSQVGDRVLTPNEHVPFLTLLGQPQNHVYWDRLNPNRDKIHLRACYCSVLDQCWMLDSTRSEQEPVAACPAKQETDYRG